MKTGMRGTNKVCGTSKRHIEPRELMKRDRGVSIKPLWWWLWVGTPRVDIIVTGLLLSMFSMYRAPIFLLHFVNLPIQGLDLGWIMTTSCLDC